MERRTTKYQKENISLWAYNFITNKITRSLSIIFVDKKYDFIIFYYHIFDFAKIHHQSQIIYMLKQICYK